jgi:hypothetical protein
VDTLLVRRGSQLLDREDGEMRAVFMKGYTEHLAVTFNSAIDSVRHDGPLFHLSISHDDSAPSNRDSEALLYCIGRVPNSDHIGIANTDLKPNARRCEPEKTHLRQASASRRSNKEGFEGSATILPSKRRDLSAPCRTRTCDPRIRNSLLPWSAMILYDATCAPRKPLDPVLKRIRRQNF